MDFMKKTLIGLLAMSMLYAGVKIARNPRYELKASSERSKMKIESISIIRTGPRLKDNELYMATHTHLKEPSFYGGIENVVDTAMKKVDIMVVMTHEKGALEEINYEDFKKEVKEHPKYEVVDHGKYFEIKTENDSLVAIKSQELTRNKEGHVLAIGPDELVEPNQDVKELIKETKEQNGIAIIAHPMTIYERKAILPYHNATEEEIKTLEDICEEAKPDAIEEFNSISTFWLYRGNVKAEMFAEEKDLPGTAGDDSHYDIKQIGLSGIIIDKNLLDMDDLVESLRNVIRSKNFRTHKRYIGPIAFTKAFAYPLTERAYKKYKARKK